MELVYKGHEILEVPYNHPGDKRTSSFIIRVASGNLKGADIGYKMTLRGCHKFIDGLKGV